MMMMTKMRMMMMMMTMRMMMTMMTIRELELQIASQQDTISSQHKYHDEYEYE